MERSEVIQSWYLVSYFQFPASYSVFNLELEERESTAEAPH